MSAQGGAHCINEFSGGIEAIGHVAYHLSSNTGVIGLSGMSIKAKFQFLQFAHCQLAFFLEDRRGFPNIMETGPER
ncbi:MAG: hypothetical protein DDT25_00984 [Chloroflexi bacterium]|nr:hypothetical protein [Chloroflexota bacterium]